MDGVVVGTLGKRRRMRTLVRPRPLKEGDSSGAVWALDDSSISEQGANAPPPPASGTSGALPPLGSYDVGNGGCTAPGNVSFRL